MIQTKPVQRRSNWERRHGQASLLILHRNPQAREKIDDAEGPVSVSLSRGSPRPCHPGKPGNYRPRRPQDSAYYQYIEDYFENFEEPYEERFEWQVVLRVAPILNSEIRACVESDREGLIPWPG
jgi:hypothetical protein